VCHEQSTALPRRSLGRAVLGVALLLAGWLHAAGPAWALSLAECFDLAMGHDAEIAAARHTAQATHEVYDQSLARLLPTVQADASYGVREYGRKTFTGIQTDRYQNDRHGVSLVQPLFHRDSWYRLDQAKAEVAAADLKLKDATQSLALEVAQSYFAILVAQRNVQLAQAEVESYRQQWEKIRESLTRGFSSRTDLLDAQARSDQAEAQLITARNSLQTARLKLELRIGQAPDGVSLDNVDAAGYQPRPEAPEDWLPQIADGNLKVRIAELERNGAEANLEVQRSGHYPQLDLRASASQVYDEDAGQYQGPDNSVSLQLTVPLYEGGATSSRSRQAAYQFSAAQETLRAAQEKARTDGSQTLEDLAAAQAAIGAVKSSIVSWTAFADAAEKAYRLGLKDLSNVLDARARLYGTQRDLAAKVRDELLYRLKLDYLAGRLDRDRLEAVDRLLETKAGSDAGKPAGSADPGPVAGEEKLWPR
jgi:outer membrane protein